MAVKREFLGETPQGAPVYGYHLTNAGGMDVCVMNYGAIIRSITVPAANGDKIDVALGYRDLSSYFVNDCFLGATVGPCANRVADAKYVIDGVTYTLPANEGKNNLHSDGDNGLHKRIWDAEEGSDFVKFTIEAPDGDIGFPGNRTFSLEYSLTEDNSLTLHYHATSDKRTLINLTNHVYLNLGGHDSGSILGHTVKFYAGNFTPVKSDSIPTGEIREVAGTPFDFTTPKTIGKDIDADDEQLKFTSGYDHNYCIDDADGTRRTFADVTNPETGITMHCSTTLPGFQFYCGNFLKSGEGEGKDGATYSKRQGFCLETQMYPDSVNKENFPDPIFGPDREYDSVTVYRFS